jgi:hypothetical protein
MTSPAQLRTLETDPRDRSANFAPPHPRKPGSPQRWSVRRWPGLAMFAGIALALIIGVNVFLPAANGAYPAVRHRPRDPGRPGGPIGGWCPASALPAGWQVGADIASGHPGSG